jgi:hypothetical protein
MPTAHIGSRHVALLHDRLHPREAAFVLRCAEGDVRNMLRRGALPIVWAGRQRRVDVLDLAERLVGDELALQALALIAEQRLRLPRDPSRRPTLSAAVAFAGGVWGIAHASAVVSDSGSYGRSQRQFILDNSTQEALVSATSDDGVKR